MNFDIPDDVREIVSRARALLESDAYPLEARLAQEGFKACLPALQAARGKARAIGLFAPAIPREWGGAGLTLSQFAHLSEELGRTPLGHFIFNCQAPDAGNMELLLQH